MIKGSVLYFSLSGILHLVIVGGLLGVPWFSQPKGEIDLPAFFVRHEEITIDFEPERINPAECFPSELLKIETAEIIVSDKDILTESLLSSESSTESKPLLTADNKPPAYPRLARQLNQEGVVILLVEVSENGMVSGIKVIKSTGYKLLDDSAIKTVKEWRFIPPTKDGKKVSSSIEIPIRFKLT